MLSHDLFCPLSHLQPSLPLLHFSISSQLSTSLPLRLPSMISHLSYSLFFCPFQSLMLSPSSWLTLPLPQQFAAFFIYCAASTFPCLSDGCVVCVFSFFSYPQSNIWHRSALLGLVQSDRKESELAVSRSFTDITLCSVLLARLCSLWEASTHSHQSWAVTVVKLLLIGVGTCSGFSLEFWSRLCSEQLDKRRDDEACVSAAQPEPDSRVLTLCSSFSCFC